MKRLHIIVIIASVFLLQACVHKIVTVPAKVAYKTTKGVVKGTVAVGKPSYRVTAMTIKKTTDLFLGNHLMVTSFK